MGEQKNTQQQDVNQLLQVRREKLAALQGRQTGSVSDHEVRCNPPQPGDQGSLRRAGERKFPSRTYDVKRVMGKASFCNIQDLAAGSIHGRGDVVLEMWVSTSI